MNECTVEKVEEAAAKLRDNLTNEYSSTDEAMEHGADVLDVIAAALRQQAEQPAGAVSEDAITEAARALCAESSRACNVDKDDNWNLYADEFKAQARIVVEAVAPFLHAPAEQDTSIPDWVCEQHPWMPWPHDDCAGPGMLPRSFGELSVAVQAALAQNTQGEAVADQQMRNLVYKLRDAPTYPEYAIQAADVIEKLHAERAMVPDDAVLLPRVLAAAACYAIEAKRDSPITLGELLKYTFGNDSTSQPEGGEVVS